MDQQYAERLRGKVEDVFAQPALSSFQSAAALEARGVKVFIAPIYRT